LTAGIGSGLHRPWPRHRRRRCLTSSNHPFLAPIQGPASAWSSPPPRKGHTHLGRARPTPWPRPSFSPYRVQYLLVMPLEDLFPCSPFPFASKMAPARGPATINSHTHSPDPASLPPPTVIPKHLHPKPGPPHPGPQTTSRAAARPGKAPKHQGPRSSCGPESARLGPKRSTARGTARGGRKPRGRPPG